MAGFDTGNPHSILFTFNLRNDICSFKYADKWASKLSFNGGASSKKISGDYPPLLPSEKSVMKPGIEWCLLGREFLKKVGLGYFDGGDQAFLIPFEVSESFYADLIQRINSLTVIQSTAATDVARSSSSSAVAAATAGSGAVVVGDDEGSSTDH